MLDIVLLTGPRLNCGDYLIASRARGLFARFLPEATITEINRLRPYGEEEIRQMARADLVVLAGGPLIRNRCAEDINMAPFVESGWLAHVRTPFVIMGGGAKLKEPFAPGKLKLTAATRGLFDKLEAGPYYSGTRDFETLALLRNAGYENFRFTGCPALFAPREDGKSQSRSFHLEEFSKVVLSAGAPGGLSEDAVRQQIEVAKAVARVMPAAKLTVAFHHPVEASDGSRGLAQRLQDLACEIVDVSGGLEKMLSLYRSADLHVGYRVHAHVLMTSWHRPSVLIAEDGRASGMADVIGGRVLRSWHTESRGFLLMPPQCCPPALRRSVRVYNVNLAAEVERQLKDLSTSKMLPNTLKISVEEAMRNWFEQFRAR